MDAQPVSELLDEAGLVYVSDQMPGLSRTGTSEGFTYRNPNGSIVRSAETLERIRSLAIPPAYTRVWICPIPNGHLQATGYDARGRKQYRYHPKFREIEEQSKFDRLLAFGKALPGLRATIRSDLGAQGLSKRKVSAVVVYLLERSLIRVGNREYAKSNRSYGLTTMRSRQVSIEGSDIHFNFVGKSGIRHRIDVHDRRLARIVKRIQELPGQELFRYINDDGQVCSISSADVNAYLHSEMGEQFTAKDFRTWWGTLLALIELSLQAPPTSQADAKRRIRGAIKLVSSRLGNTATICRKCYVHPAVLKAFEDGRLAPCDADDPEELVKCAESNLLKLLAEDGRDSQAA